MCCSQGVSIARDRLGNHHNFDRVVGRAHKGPVAVVGAQRATKREHIERSDERTELVILERLVVGHLDFVHVTPKALYG